MLHASWVGGDDTSMHVNAETSSRVTCSGAPPTHLERVAAGAELGGGLGGGVAGDVEVLHAQGVGGAPRPELRRHHAAEQAFK